MTFTFRPAVREGVGLLIGLAGGTGSGKTFSAMRLAAGIAGNKPFAVIDTEAGRAKHYADQFQFDHGDLKPPFRPDAYAEAIKAADDAGYPVIVVDSVSHVWAGDGGVLDWQEDELDRMAGDDWKKREACKMAAWIKPKMGHKAMVQKLLQVRATVILCFRAEEKIEMVREDGRMKIVPKQGPTGLHGWMPVCEKNLPFELTCSFLLTADAPGYPKPIKLQEQHKALFPLDKVINEQSGKLVAQWAQGKPKESAPPQSGQPPLPAAGTLPADGADTTTAAGQGKNGSREGESDAPRLENGPAPAATNTRKLITEALAFTSAELTARYTLKMKGRTLDQLNDEAAAGVLAWLNRELDK